MKRINKKSDIPAWFSLDSYQIINNISDKDLIDQLTVRKDALTSNFKPTIHDPELMRFRIEINEEILSKVLWPLSSETFYIEVMNRKKYSNLQMSGLGGVEPLRLIDVTHMAKKTEKYIDENKIKRSLRGQKRAVSKTICNRDEMILSIDLAWPDNIIVKDIVSLLPVWRKELGLKNGIEDKSSSSWSVIKKKLIEYKIIPLLDLLHWSNVTDSSITNRVLAITLFPDGEYDSTNISQTIKPFIDNLFKDFSIENLKRKAIEELER